MPRRRLRQPRAPHHRMRAAEAFAKVFAKVFAEVMGVRYNRVRITEMRYRWASCTPAGNLCFTPRIMKAPPPVIDYLIVHELAHLLEPNHTPRFWAIVAAQLPHAQRRRAWLREHGAELEVEF